MRPLRICLGVGICLRCGSFEENEAIYLGDAIKKDVWRTNQKVEISPMEGIRSVGRR